MACEAAALYEETTQGDCPVLSGHGGCVNMLHASHTLMQIDAFLRMHHCDALNDAQPYEFYGSSMQLGVNVP